ncbi:MAG: bacteriohopanetetrol glucosamine biosynthesis glycosyltransferase HpnI [Sphingomonadales bacterium]|nr:bacteriohopanetetrol glucosamine biosynthesis glycosyltransferase HpnI [Sphingomonadales bacterium]MDE2171692.1 bacteriohopanetetrol glucosamine biosynthesis glycosyltransferase HpnI [Sphingomonadales bacterium]
MTIAALSGVGSAYHLAMAHAVRRYFKRHAPRASHPAPVTLLKPLYGAEPRLTENLASFLAQDYAAPVQMVCGINTPDDTARPQAETLIAAHPEANIALSPGPRAAGANGKVGNLVAMMPLARHDVLILSDSDMVVERDYLSTVVGALEQPGVGLVSCLYLGRGDAGLWSQIGAAMISFQQTPNMIFALTHGLAQPCMGSTIALRRETLDAIGGFERFADVLADDHAMGAAVREMGLSIAIPPIFIDHAGDEASLSALWRHFLRWAVTIRDLNPGGHYGSVVTMPLPLALIALMLAPEAGGLALAVALAARITVARAIRHAASRKSASLWCMMAGDVLGFGIFCVSLFARVIDWRGATLTMSSNGRIRHTPEREPRATAGPVPARMRDE